MQPRESNGSALPRAKNTIVPYTTHSANAAIRALSHTKQATPTLFRAIQESPDAFFSTIETSKKIEIATKTKEALLAAITALIGTPEDRAQAKNSKTGAER